MSNKNIQTIYSYPTNSNSSPYVVTVGAGGGGGSSSTYTGNLSLPSTWATTGSSGMYLTSSGYVTNTTKIKAEVTISGKNPTLSTDSNKIDLDEMAGIIATLKDVFFILPKNQKLIDENPTLKDAWEQYETVLRKNLKDSALIEAYNQYKTLEALSKEEQHDNS